MKNKNENKNMDKAKIREHIIFLKRECSQEEREISLFLKERDKY